MFNTDEIFHTVVQCPGEIIAQNGKHQVGAITSYEWGQTVLCIVCGFYVLPMLINPRKGTKESLSFWTPQDAAFCCQERGWMNTEVFSKWMHNFISVLKPMPKQTFL